MTLPSGLPIGFKPAITCIKKPKPCSAYQTAFDTEIDFHGLKTFVPKGYWVIRDVDGLMGIIDNESFNNNYLRVVE